MLNIQKFAAEIIKSNSFISNPTTAINLAKNADRPKEISIKSLANEIWRQCQIRRDRQKNTSAVPALRMQLELRLRNKLSAILQEGFSYRQPETKWVDINNTIKVILTLGKTSTFLVQTQTIYHPKHNWRANETKHTLFLNPLDTFTTVGGLLTVYKKADSLLNVIPCRWWEQSRGFNVREVSGYLVDNLFHVEVETIQEAVKKAAILRKTRKNEILLELGKFDEVAFTVHLAHKKYGFCLAGIRQFCYVNSIENEDLPISGRELRCKIIANREVNCRLYRSYLLKMGLVLNCK